MSEQQYYYIQLNLSNTFLKWAYGHRLVDGDIAKQFWKDKQAPHTVAFGGLNSTQFTSLAEIQSFNEAFDNLLAKHDINVKHKHPLKYFMIFLHNDYETQSLANNAHNGLLEYAQFILNIYTNSKRHFEAMAKNPAYQMIYDEMTQEYLFATKKLYESMPLDELVEYIPDTKHADDVIRYLRITIGENELYIPPGMEMTVTNDKELRNLLGATIQKIPVPAYLQYNIFSYVINEMVEAHKKANTIFYQYLTQKEAGDADLRRIYNQYKKSYVSQSQSLLRVAIMISDYLKEQKLITVKRKAAVFLHGYFSLFKAFIIKSGQTLPEDYSELNPFYVRNHISPETIRLMLKDVGEI